MIINNNLSALNTWNKAKRSNDKREKNIEKLSSGSRINSASDDAAGSAISQKMRAQIRGLNQASRNIQDSISLLQTAESAMGEIQSFNQRLRELAIQGGNDTLTYSDREMIVKEVQEIREGIDDIVSTTVFNNKELLNGDYRGYYYGETDTDIVAIPAKPATISAKFPASITVAPGVSDTIKIKVDGIENSITLSGGTYDLNSLESEINNKLSTASINASVKHGSGTLTFKHTIEGASYSIDSVFGNLITNNATVSIQGASYPSSIIQGTLTSTESTTQGISLQPWITQGESNLVSIWSGTMLDKTFSGSSPPYTMVNRNNILIDGTNNELSFDINGTPYTITIPPANYDVSDVATSPLLTEINDKLQAIGCPVEAKMAGYAGDGINDKLNGEAIRFVIKDPTVGATYTIGNFRGSAKTTLFDTYVDGWTHIDAVNSKTETVTGSSAHINGRKDLSSGIVIDSANKELKIDIDGSTQTITLTEKSYTAGELITELNARLTGATASLDASNKLVITNSSQGSSSTIANVNGSAYEALFVDKSPARVVGAIDLSGGVVIDSTNKELSIDIDGSTQIITLTEKSYTTGELITELNAKLTGATASLDASNKLVITNSSQGSSSTIMNITGSAYEELFCTGTPGKIVGTANLSSGVVIDSANKELSVEIYGNIQIITLTERSYTAGELITELNAKLTGATASLDSSNRLMITNNSHGNSSTIANVNGSAYETLFVKRTSAQAIGKRNLSGGVVIDSTNKELSIDIDGSTQMITLTEKSYTAGELITELNAKLTGATASLDSSNKLIITTDSIGDSSSITNILGSSILSLFSEDFSKTEGTDNVYEKEISKIYDLDKSILSQIGANANNTKVLTIEKLDSSELGYIEPNPDLSSAEGADNAISIIDNAIYKVSTEMSKVGAASNSLEYTLNNIENYAENLTAAKSRISDADMAKEIIEKIKEDILTQALQTMSAQANATPQNILSLLK